MHLARFIDIMDVSSGFLKILIIMVAFPVSLVGFFVVIKLTWILYVRVLKFNNIIVGIAIKK